MLAYYGVNFSENNLLLRIALSLSSGSIRSVSIDFSEVFSSLLFSSFLEEVK